MNRTTAVLTLLLLAPGAAPAQTTIEIGSGIGASVLSSNGVTFTSASIPGPGVGALSLFGQTPLYVSIITGGFLIQPELAFSFFSGEGTDLTLMSFIGNLGWYFGDGASNAPYVSVNGGVVWVNSGGDSDDEFGAGAKVGYRFRVGHGLAISLEGGYRRWTDSEANEFLVGMRIGGIVSSP